MLPLLLSDVLRATGGTPVGGVGETRLTGVTTDSRQVAPGTLFVALRGERFDGHDFLASAARAGARAALVDRPVVPTALTRDVTPDATPMVPIRVADTRRAFGALARFHALRLPARRVGVTGSNGKTTTKELLRAALAAAGPTVASERSFNNDVGLPLTLLRIDAGTAFAVLEIGTNHPGEIARLAELGQPELGVVTNCAPAHIEFLRDLDGVVEEKGALVAALPRHGVAVLNADDASFEALRARARCRIVTFGVRRPADYRAVDIRFDLRRLVYHLRGERVYVPLGGCHNVMNSLAALAAADSLGVPLRDAIRALRRVEGPPMRLTPIRLPGITLIDDSYNANPGSVEAALRTLAAAPVRGRRVVVLGDMLELGPHAGPLHRKVGELMSLLGGPTELVAVGPHAGDLLDGARSRGFAATATRAFATAAAAAEAVPALLVTGDTVLVKGSRGMHMEQVADAITRAWSAGGGGGHGDR